MKASIKQEAGKEGSYLVLRLEGEGVPALYGEPAVSMRVAGCHYPRKPGTFQLWRN